MLTGTIAKRRALFTFLPMINNIVKLKAIGFIQYVARV